MIIPSSAINDSRTKKKAPCTFSTNLMITASKSLFFSPPFCFQTHTSTMSSSPIGR